MKKGMLGMALGLILLAGVAWGGLEGPQDAWYEVDAWHSWVEGGTTNYLGRSISSMAIGPDERLYVLDDTSDCIVVFEQDATFVRKWGSPGTGPGQFDFRSSWGDIAFDATGRVYVADVYNHRVQVFEPDGAFVAQWGATNSAGNPVTGTGDGQFNVAAAIAVGTNDLVYVVDYSNYRVQVFEQDGTFVKKFGGQGNLDGQFAYRLNPHSIAIDNQEVTTQVGF